MSVTVDANYRVFADAYPLRRPFELFDRGQFDTYLLCRTGAPARVIPVEKGAAVPVNDGLDADGKRFGVATTVVPLNAVEATVFKQLRLDLPEAPRDND